MNGQIERVTISTVGSIVAKADLTNEHRAAIMKLSVLSNPLCVGSYDDEIICLVGLIPRSFVSDWAHVWLNDFPAVRKHRVIFARHARRLIANWRQHYRLEGMCVTPESWRWLRSLGATSTSPTTFEIV